MPVSATVTSSDLSVPSKTNEVVTEIMIPPAGGTTSAFVKRTRIKGHDLALVNGAAACENGSGLRLALGAVAATPVLIDRLGGIGPGDRQRIVEVTLAAVSPIDDVRSSGRYRIAMVKYIIETLLDRVITASQGA